MKKALTTKFEFLTGNPPHSFGFSGQEFLYNLPEYIGTWPDFNAHSFYILHKIKKQIVGYIRFQEIEERAYSPYMAPFGSFTISEDIKFDILNEFNVFIINYFKTIGIKKIIIKHYPRFYQSDCNDLIIASMGLIGFQITAIDINQYIEVSDSPFSTFIHPMELRYLKKSKRAGMVFNAHQNIEVESLFNYIESFRKARKIPVNINLSTLKKLFTKFPNNYRCFSVSMNEEIIAATISVHVNDRVLYNFLPAHNDQYNNYSPMIYLMNGIYEHAILHKYKYLDLGISSKDGTAQPGLIKFKERLGAKSASKLTFMKEIR